MRPDEPSKGREIHECFGCGKRVEEPDARFCPACGSELRNISRARDL